MSETGQLSVERRGEVALVTLSGRRSATRSRSSCARSSPTRSPRSPTTTRSAASCSPAPVAPSARAWTPSQFGGDLDNRERLVETSTLAFEAVGDCRRPVVAAVNGPALAGGFALSLLCDLRVASDSAQFGYPELPRGIPPSYAAARAVLPATVAKELCLTGRVVGAAEAQRLGIVREVAGGDVVERAVDLASGSPRCRAQAILETKRRTLLERRHLWGFLFDEEERVFRRALLGETEPASAPVAGARRPRGCAARRRSPRPPRRSGPGSRSRRWRRSPRAGRATRCGGWRSPTPPAAGTARPARGSRAGGSSAPARPARSRAGRRAGRR